MQHAVDLHGLDGGALQRRQQHAAQRVAERHAEAALERLGDDGRHLVCGRGRALISSLLGLIRSCQFFCRTFTTGGLA